MKDPQLSGIAKALAAHGRKGDTELIHVSKDELKTLEKYGDQLGIHLTTNPTTGLPEAFNWGGTLGSVGLPLLVLAATAATGGVAAPWMLAAAGAAGGAGGTLATGGSTDEALMSGVMGGIGGYGMGSMAGNFAAEGAKAAAADAAVNATTNVAADAGTQALSSSAPGIFSQGLGQTGMDVTAQTAASNVPGIFGQGLTQSTGQSTLQTLGQQGAQQAAQVSGSLLPQTGSTVAQGATNLGSVPLAPGQSITDALLVARDMGNTAVTGGGAAPMTGLEQMAKGFGAVTSSPQAAGSFLMNNASNIGMTGIGAIGAGSSMNPQEQTITTESESTENPYVGEMYIDPATGQRRSRAVLRAAGGSIYGDYDGVEDASFNEGGSTESTYTPNEILIANTEPAGWVEEALRKGYPGKRRRLDEYAGGGGISDLGSYSDGGRTLRGPGDGVSDSIPATIEGKRPARLADGEFVIPARAVSELGNGSTEAGSKQLYAMLDRIAAKRKKGKGLAYQANPKKLLPA